MTDSEPLTFEYKIIGPDAQFIDGQVITTGTVTDWTGTAHDLGREILKRWQATPSEDQYAGVPVVVEVGSAHGPRAFIDDPAPAGSAEQALEAAIEAKLVADLASDRTRDELAEAMRDACRWGGMSKNKIADRVALVMSRPTALKQLKGAWPADESYDLTVEGRITYDIGAGGMETVTCPTCGAKENHTVFGSLAEGVRVICEVGHPVELPTSMNGRRLLKLLIENPYTALNRFRAAE